MTPKIALFFGITAASLALVSPAYGVFPTVDGGDSGYAKGDGSSVGLTFNGSPDAFDRAVAAHQMSQATFNGSPDAIDRALASERLTQTRFNGSPDAIDRFRGAVTDLQVTVVGDDSGREIDFSQLGILGGIALALGLGLVLALRARRHTPLAH